MSRARGTRTRPPVRLFLGTAFAAVSLFGAAPAAAQTRPGTDCELCHGELEFLRTQTGSLAEAQRLLATVAEVHGSAHTGMDCAECHTGFARFPHSQRTSTRSCASCHEAADSLWHLGVHADSTNAEPVGCTSCHGTHSVMTVEAMSEEAGAGRLNGRCTECHESSRLAPDDPHARAVLCTGCHMAHDMKRVDDAEAGVAVRNQHGTCGACHAEETVGWNADAHGQAVFSPELVRDSTTAPPACTACHGTHGMVATDAPHFSQDMVEKCAGCHQGYADTYFGTYHGKATALGSEIVATCDQCHGAHHILPAADPLSTVARHNLTATCGACHEAVRPSFVEYDSHPDPFNRERNPSLHFSFMFMNSLLVGVLGVFGLHTALWWVRLKLDRRRGVTHEIGGDHD